MKKRCDDCAGTGKIIQDGIEEYCPICDGDRYVEVEPETNLNVVPVLAESKGMALEANIQLAPLQVRESTKSPKKGEILGSMPISRGGVQNNLLYVESFSAWLDSQGDAMAPADSFSQWLAERNDSI